MSSILQSSGWRRFLFLTAFGLVLIGFSLSTPAPSRAHPLAGQDYGGQDPGELYMPNPYGQVPGDDDFMPRRGTRRKTSRKKSLLSTKGSAKKTETTKKTKNAGTKTDSVDNGKVMFSQEIAPILVASCVGCHSGDNAGARRGKLDLTTFEGLMNGTQKRPDDREIVIAGKPEQSHLVLRIKGDEEPRMPQGNQNRMSDGAIAKIEQWIKEGAKLDAGFDPKKAIASYAATPEQVRRRQMAKLPPRERDQKIEAVGRERWKQANPKLKPEIASDEHFIVFSNLPNDRATSTLKAMETQYGHLARLMGPPATEWVEKVSLYVFSSRKDFIEFVRSVESREVDGDDHSSAKLTVPQPYLAVVDPAGGKKDESTSGRRRSRSRRSTEGDGGESAGADRSLVGILTEDLATAVMASCGNSPRWLSEGLGAYMASQVEPRSPYYRQLRQTAFANFEQGWKAKATEALGGSDQITADGVRAIGFALVEAMMSEMRHGVPAFIKAMMQGEKFDEVLQMAFGGGRDEFLEGTGGWVETHYGRLQ